MPQRKIIHIDMDAFFASVEQRDDPSLRGKPVVVGGSPQSRGVVAAASYEARKFGIRSAIPCSQAVRLCPHAVFVRPRFDAYRDVSRQIMEIFHEYSDLVEPLSLDEAYIDVTENKIGNPSATRIAEEIRERIFRETALTASAGVAPNKFLAKIASDMNKPNGLTVIPPERVEEVLRTLPVRKIPGVGKVTEERLLQAKIVIAGDFRKFTSEELVEKFGKQGEYFFRIAFGTDDRAVIPSRERKSVGVEDTFAKDIIDMSAIQSEISRICKEVWRRLKDRRGRTVTIKVTYAGFEKVTRAFTLPEAVESPQHLEQVARELFAKTELGVRPARLIGVALSHFHGPKEKEVQIEFPFQLPLFRQEEEGS